MHLKVGRRPLRLALRLFLAVAAGLVLAELGLRTLLFSEVRWIARLGQPLRQAEFYTHHRNGDEGLIVRSLFFPSRLRAAVKTPHPELGWIRAALLDPVTLRQRTTADDGVQRPVLFYGDSFTQCVRDADVCWGELLEESEFGDRSFLVNYGTGGYGVDQMYLLLQKTLAHWEERDPLVLIGILVDDDLDRCVRSLFKYCKPRFFLIDGELQLVPPEPDVQTFVERHPPRIASYLWRAVLYRTELVPYGLRQRWTAAARWQEEKSDLARALVPAIHDLLEARGVEHAFVRFHGRDGAFRARGRDWREELLLETFRAHDLPFVSTKPDLVAHHAATGGDVADYYFPNDAGGRNHLTGLGNRVAFGALRRALAGERNDHERLSKAR